MRWFTHSPQRLMVSAVSGLVLLVALFVAGFQSAQSGPSKSTTGGQPGPTASLAVDAADGSLLSAGGGLFRSSDQGQSWSTLSLPTALQADKIDHVATSLAAPSSVYAAGPGAGVVRSDDGGQNWRAINGGLPSSSVAALAVHSLRPDTLYASIEGQGVFRTEDSGGRWQKMDAGPPATIAALAHSTLEGSMNSGWLYAATPEGPYLSMDCF